MTRFLTVTACVTTLVLAGCQRAAPEPWQAIEIGTDAGFSDLFFIDASTGWMVGGSPFVEGGIVGRTTDGGQTWSYRTGLVPVETGVSVYGFGAVHFFDAQHGCIAGNGGKILLTADGGDNWRIVRRGNGLTDHLSELQFLDRNEGWVVGLGGVLHTEDGGESWSRRGPKSDGYDDVAGAAIHFTDRYDGWVAGQHTALWHTTDGGYSWERIRLVPQTSDGSKLPYLFDMAWVGRSMGWIVGDNGTIFHTIDSGATWARQECGCEGAFLTAVQFLDAQNGWIVGFWSHQGRSLVLRTADGGATWVVEYQIDGEELRAVQMLDASTGWAVGDRARTAPQKLLRRVGLAAAR